MCLGETGEKSLKQIISFKNSWRTVIPTSKTNTKAAGVTNSPVQTAGKCVWAKLEEPSTKDITNNSNL